MTWKLLSIPLVCGGLLIAVFFADHGGANFDERVPVGPRGSIAVDIVLGGGISVGTGSRAHAGASLESRA